MTGDHGVYDNGLPDNVTPLRSSRKGSPSCPHCGKHDTTSRVNHPAGEFFCTCGHLFTGSDREWHGLADKRNAAQRATPKAAGAE